MITSAIHHLILDNPMTLEGTRVWRRFLRTGGDTGRGVNAAVAGLLGFFYLWLLIATIHFQEDLSQGLLLVELVLLTLLVPASLYGAISSEREKLTWDALILTRLTPGQITIGKLLWRVTLIVGIQLLFAPLLLVSHVVGKQGPDYTLHNLLMSQVILFTWSLLLAGFSLWVSARTKRSVTSLALIASGLLGFLAVIPMLVLLFGGGNAIEVRVNGSLLQQLGGLLIHLNPLLILWDDLFRGRRIFDGWDLWRVLGVVGSVPWIYSLGALLFLVGTWRTLRGLEVARRGKG